MSKDYFSVHFDDKPEITFEVVENNESTFTDISGNLIDYVPTNGYQSRSGLLVRLAWMDPYETVPLGTPLYVMSKLQFLERFTAEERIAIREASKTNPYVEDFLELLNAASEVNVQYQPTIDAVNALASLGLISSNAIATLLEPVYA